MVLTARGQVTLHTESYPLTDFAQALDHLGSGNIRGRAILVP
jgi:NAD+-dependent secondary alcohol dehydrogenase Adh1